MSSISWRMISKVHSGTLKGQNKIASSFVGCSTNTAKSQVVFQIDLKKAPVCGRIDSAVWLFEDTLRLGVLNSILRKVQLPLWAGALFDRGGFAKPTTPGPVPKRGNGFTPPLHLTLWESFQAVNQPKTPNPT
jgi:hypothetical protein